MADDEEITEKVSSLVRKRLPASAVHAVSIVRDRNGENEKILRVMVVVDRKTGRLDSSSMLGLIGSLHGELVEDGIEDYPIISFVSENDAAKLTREPA